MPHACPALHAACFRTHADTAIHPVESACNERKRGGGVGLTIFVVATPVEVRTPGARSFRNLRCILVPRTHRVAASRAAKRKRRPFIWFPRPLHIRPPARVVASGDRSGFQATSFASSVIRRLHARGGSNSVALPPPSCSARRARRTGSRARRSSGSGFADEGVGVGRGTVVKKVEDPLEVAAPKGLVAALSALVRASAPLLRSGCL